MKKFTKSLVAAGLMASMSAPVLADGVSVNASLVSNYVWRGVQQSTTAMPTEQGGIDYAKGPWSVGTWGSSLGSAGTEIDLYGAYNFGPAAVGLIYYYYPVDTGTSPSFYEVNVGGNVGPVSLKASYTPDNYAQSGSAYYLEAAYSLAVTKGVNLNLHGGYGDSTSGSVVGAKFDYSAGVSGDAGGVTLGALYAYSETTSEGKAVVSVSKSM